jgi:hypothetical protein
MQRAGNHTSATGRFPTGHNPPMKPATLPILALLCCASACVSTPSTSIAGIEEAERARFAAWVKGDVAEIAPLLADDLRYCHSSGVCETKAELLQSLASGKTVYKGIDVIEMRPRSADGAAIINGVVAIRVESSGTPLAFKGIYTSVYVKRDGRWLLTAWQSTPAPK